MSVPEMQPVSSSCISSVGYDAENQAVFVAFLNGSIYAYKGVPEHEFENLRTAPSVGSYFNRNFSNVYSYENVDKATKKPFAKNEENAKRNAARDKIDEDLKMRGAMPSKTYSIEGVADDLAKVLIDLATGYAQLGVTNLADFLNRLKKRMGPDADELKDPATAAWNQAYATANENELDEITSRIDPFDDETIGEAARKLYRFVIQRDGLDTSAAGREAAVDAVHAILVNFVPAELTAAWNHIHWELLREEIFNLLMEGNQDQATIEAHRNHEAAQGQAEGILIDDSARAAFEKEYRDVFSEWEGYEYGSDDFRQATAKMKAMEDSHPDWTEEITNADPSFDKAWLKKMRPKTANDVGESAPSQKVPCRPTFVKRWSTAEPPRAFMDFISIPAGSFTMGSPKTEEDRWSDEKQMEVTITRALELGKTVVTQKQWTEVMGTDPWNRGRKEETGDNYPAVYVSWDDASLFCEHLTSYEREAGRLSANQTYRLPTEAEWEYACRAGTTTAYSFGDDAKDLGKYAWFDQNSGKTTHPVGVKLPNGWGLYDMHGNVWEWCSDLYKSGDQNRVLRGGSWYGYSGYARSACRVRALPDKRYDFNGFRVVRGSFACLRTP